MRHGSGLLGKAFEVSLHLVEHGNPFTELRSLTFDKCGDVTAGSFTSVPEGEDLSDFPEGEPDRLSSTDEAEAGGGLVAVVAVPAVTPRRSGHNSDPLVVADGRRFDARMLCHFSDAHRTDNNPLDLVAGCKVYGPRRRWDSVAKRQVEVFTAGCPVCEPVVQLVQEMACPHCEVTIHDLRQSGAAKAAEYGITTVPAVVVDGNLASCCQNRGPGREDLAAAGIGQRL
jgi:glutaredoxin 3